MGGILLLIVLYQNGKHTRICVLYYTLLYLYPIASPVKLNENLTA